MDRTAKRVQAAIGKPSPDALWEGKFQSFWHDFPAGLAQPSAACVAKVAPANFRNEGATRRLFAPNFLRILSQNSLSGVIYMCVFLLNNPHCELLSDYRRLITHGPKNRISSPVPRNRRSPFYCPVITCAVFCAQAGIQPDSAIHCRGLYSYFSLKANNLLMCVAIDRLVPRP